MKVLLANPPCRIDLGKGQEKFFVRAGSRWPFSVTKKKEDKADYLPFPFYLAYSAALLKNKGFSVLVDDALTLNKTQEEFLNDIVKSAPDIILYETSTPTIKHDLVLAQELKKIMPKLIIVLAGPHITTFPKETLKECAAIDYGIIQEYELALAELVEKLSKREDVSNISGLVWRDKEEVKVNPAMLIDPLDQLPMPARELFSLDYYWDGFCQHKPAIQMHATRGCPFRCNFCLWNQVVYNNGKYRMFSVKRVIDEMEECIKKYGAQEIYFDDDTFTANKKFVLDFCRELKNRGLKIHWSCMGDAMVTDEEMVEAMASAGCVGMKFGVESGDPEVLKKIEKPVDLNKIKRVASLLAKRHIKTHATFTFGLSGETKESMQRTIDFAKELDVDSVQFSINTPFPGTRYYAEAKEKGLLLTENWQDFDGSSKSVVRFEGLNTEDVASLHCRASGIWFRHKIKDPRWLFRQFYNLGRMMRGQGLSAVIARCKRGISLMSGK